jgi:hypothetical protein
MTERHFSRFLRGMSHTCEEGGPLVLDASLSSSLARSPESHVTCAGSQSSTLGLSGFGRSYIHGYSVSVKIRTISEFPSRESGQKMPR